MAVACDPRPEEGRYIRLCWQLANFCDPASSQHHNSGGGGSPEFFFDSSVSQQHALATLKPIWGRVAQGALELPLPQIRK